MFIQRVTFVFKICCDELNFQFMEEIEVKCQGPKKEQETVGMQTWMISNLIAKLNSFKFGSSLVEL